MSGWRNKTVLVQVTQYSSGFNFIDSTVLIEQWTLVFQDQIIDIILTLKSKMTYHQIIKNYGTNYDMVVNYT